MTNFPNLIPCLTLPGNLIESRAVVTRSIVEAMMDLIIAHETLTSSGPVST